MNLDSKILSERLVNWIQPHIKEIIHHDHAGFVPGMQGWFNTSKLINGTHKQIQGQKSMAISIDIEKGSNKVHHLFKIKTLRKLELEETYFNEIKAM